MKKLLLTATFLLLSVPTAQASPQVEACLNKTIAETRSSVSSAKLIASIEHEGRQYHYIEGTSEAPRVPETSIFLMTDSQGGCEEVLSYLAGSAPDEEVYRERLGSEAFDKLRKKTRAALAQQEQ